jgi:hypothetical protein
MPLPSKLRQLIGTAQFWSDYFLDETFGEPVAGLHDDPFVEFPLSPQYSLRIGYVQRPLEGGDFIQATDLELRQMDSGQDKCLAWYDSHCHPHSLRWEEADLIGRLLAQKDPDLPQPGIPFLLLLPYIASIEGSDHLLGLQLLNSALRSLGVFNERQIRYRLYRFACVPAESAWRRVHNYGWVCHFLGKFSWQGGGKTIHSIRRVPVGRQAIAPAFRLTNGTIAYATSSGSCPNARKDNQRKQRPNFCPGYPTASSCATS